MRCVLILLLFSISATAQVYHNPIIHADYSDPDAIRVGNDYYMTASSFNAVPGLAFSASVTPLPTMPDLLISIG